MSQIRAGLRQRRHHRAFRISAPTWDDAQIERLEQTLTGFTGLDRSPEPKPEPEPEAEAGPVAEVPPPAPDLDDAALVDAATNLWRAQKKLEQIEGRPSRQAHRYLRNSHDALTKAGLVIQDHDGDGFHPGQSLEAVIVQPDPALTAAVVLETVRPSVYFRERRIQMGQVIVGIPVERELGGEDRHA
ncbi:MAG: hypothetical protein ACRDRK_25485 [Pseudonocardia sp.]